MPLTRAGNLHGRIALRLGGTRVEFEKKSVYDVVIVGAGPAGISAPRFEQRSITSKALTLERESVGGTVSKYPRQKLVMTSPSNSLSTRPIRQDHTLQRRSSGFLGKDHGADRLKYPYRRCRRVGREARGKPLRNSPARRAANTLRALSCWLLVVRELRASSVSRAKNFNMSSIGSSKPITTPIRTFSLSAGATARSRPPQWVSAHQSGNKVTLSYRRNEFSRQRS